LRTCQTYGADLARDYLPREGHTRKVSGMARRVRVIEILIDDFDGKELPEGEGQSFQFNWQGVDYELDASEEHANSYKP
jgi:hypothetical protein